MPSQEKVQFVESTVGEFRSAGSVFVADFSGLKVSDMTELRKQLREAGTRFLVAKNTLLRRAAGSAGMTDLDRDFKGPTAVAFGPADPVRTAKIFQEFVARLERPKVRRFIVERRAYAPTDLKAMASLPSREVLLSQIVAAVESPISGFIGILDAIVREFVGTVDALARKKGEAEGAAGS
ncbi:MAG: 50S ribosomal protein L10 [candidate division Zixibacteria bacterium]|nr:50S ribosomal protein L10 [candidate division Zixibacteria bacterium]